MQTASIDPHAIAIVVALSIWNNREDGDSARELHSRLGASYQLAHAELTGLRAAVTSRAILADPRLPGEFLVLTDVYCGLLLGASIAEVLKPEEQKEGAWIKDQLGEFLEQLRQQHPDHMAIIQESLRCAVDRKQFRARQESYEKILFTEGAINPLRDAGLALSTAVLGQENPIAALAVAALALSQHKIVTTALNQVLPARSE